MFHMKFILFPIVFLLFLSVPAFAGTPCYQESANVATDCGGLATGGYGVENLYRYGSLFVNYSKPLYALNATWNVSYDVWTTLYENELYPMPTDCFNRDILQLRINASTYSTPVAGQPTVSGDCWDGTQWVSLFIVNDGVQNCFGGSDSTANVIYAYDGDWNYGSVAYMTCGDNGVRWSGIDKNNGNSMATIIEEAMVWDMQPPPPPPPFYIIVIPILIGIGLSMFVLRTIREGELDTKKIIGIVLTVLIGLTFMSILTGLV